MLLIVTRQMKRHPDRLVRWFIMLELWWFLGWWVLNVNPIVVRDVLVDGAYLPFVGLVFFVSLGTLWGLQKQLGFSLRWAGVVAGISYLLLSSWGNLVTIGLSIGTVIAFEYFLRFSRSDQ